MQLMLFSSCDCDAPGAVCTQYSRLSSAKALPLPLHVAKAAGLFRHKLRQNRTAMSQRYHSDAADPPRGGVDHFLLKAAASGSSGPRLTARRLGFNICNLNARVKIRGYVRPKHANSVSALVSSRANATVPYFTCHRGRSRRMTFGWTSNSNRTICRQISTVFTYSFCSSFMGRITYYTLLSTPRCSLAK